MDVLATQSATRAANQTATTAEAGSSSMITADFQSFLRLLTTQMQNQDPLNPMESTEFATQLATFSGVEQQVRTNDLLAELQAGFATLGMGQLGGWIGMEARADRPVNFDGAPVTVAGTPMSLADRMELVVRTPAGEVVQRMPIPLDDAAFTWTGAEPGGTPVLPGTYQLSIENWAGEEVIGESGAMVYGTINEAQMRDGEVWLTLADGAQIPASGVLGLRAP